MDNLGKVSLSFHHMNPDNGTHVVRHGEKYLYLMNHLIGHTLFLIHFFTGLRLTM